MNHNRTTKRKKSRRARRSRTQRKVGSTDRQLRRLRKDLGIVPLNEVKKRAIKRAVELAKGDKQLAALLLGVGKNTVYRYVE